MRIKLQQKSKKAGNVNWVDSESVKESQTEDHTNKIFHAWPLQLYSHDVCKWNSQGYSPLQVRFPKKEKPFVVRLLSTT